jgi:hypothetical protein
MEGYDSKRTAFWDAYGVEARKLAEFMRGVEESKYYHRAHATTFCSAFGCPRSVAFEALGWDRDMPMGWRAQSTFATGYTTELKIKTLLQLEHAAWIDVERPYPLGDDWQVPDGGHMIHVQPDLVMSLPVYARKMFEEEHGIKIRDKICVEIKSIGSKGYSRLTGWARGAIAGISANRAGWYEQAQMEMLGTGTRACLFIVEQKDSQYLYEEAVGYDKQAVRDLVWRFRDVYKHRDPFYFNVPIHLRPEGKETEDRLKLSWQCVYCGYHDVCWSHEGYSFSVEKGKGYVRKRKARF